MKVKKYVAPTMPEAMKLIRKELGSEAVILSSREGQHGGFLGFFKKKHIEVVAALDPHPKSIKPVKKTPISSLSVGNQAAKKKDSTDEVLTEIKNLKKIIEIQSQQSHDQLQPDYKLAVAHLLDQEVSQQLAEEMIHTVLAKHQENDIQPNLERIIRDIGSEIEGRLLPLTKQESYNGKIIQFIGPTGVGKTTTIAKIAASIMLTDNNKVAFITGDTYRIAAIEQLKTYARILNVPLEVAYTAQDYKHAIEKFTSYDLILVDTAGRNFRDDKYVNELKNTMDQNLGMITYLVLSLTAKPKDLTEIYEQFYQIPINAVIFTKVDETRQYGSILNIALEKQIGIAYLTNGQDVPNDLLKVTPKLISNLIVGEHDGE